VRGIVLDRGPAAWPSEKARLEWFFQSALQAELGDSIDIGRLYTDYRKFGMGQRTPILAERQLQLLNAYAENYTQFTSGAGDAPIAQFGKRMASWDAAPTHALALRVASLGLATDDEKSIYDDIMVVSGAPRDLRAHAEKLQ
jgi:hypothetical protein